MTCRVAPVPTDVSLASSVAFAGGSDVCLYPRTATCRLGSVGDVDQRRCLWCRGVVPAGMRRDTKFCDKSCRQASWRFGVCRSKIEATARPMIFAYADPPYPGKAMLYPEKSEVDHASLIEELTKNYPDGWALSTSSEALRDVLSLAPGGVRICAWFKGPRYTKSRRALVSWEPLIVSGGRPLQVASVQDLGDGLIARGRFRAFPGALVGMKPPAFAEWMFRQLGASRADRLDDLFPGSGAISRAWARYTGNDPAVTIVGSDATSSEGGRLARVDLLPATISHRATSPPRKVSRR